MEEICEVEAHIEPSVRRVVARWGHDPVGLVQILREVHEEFGCLPSSALALIARCRDGNPRHAVSGEAG